MNLVIDQVCDRISNLTNTDQSLLFSLTAWRMMPVIELSSHWEVSAWHERSGEMRLWRGDVDMTKRLLGNAFNCAAKLEAPDSRASKWLEDVTSLYVYDADCVHTQLWNAIVGLIDTAICQIGEKEMRVSPLAFCDIVLPMKEIAERTLFGDQVTPATDEAQKRIVAVDCLQKELTALNKTLLALEHISQNAGRFEQAQLLIIKAKSEEWTTERLFPQGCPFTCQHNHKW